MDEIYDAVIECTRLFELLAGVNSNARKLQNDEVRDENAVQEADNSFQRWITYTGALAADISRSLDARLQKHEDIKEMVLELLEQLRRNLHYLLYGAESLDDDDVETEAEDAIRLGLEDLHFMAAAIRRSSVRSHEYNLSTHFERDDDLYFTRHAALLVRHFFPFARRSLSDHLGESIAARRKRILHKVQHEAKLATRRKPAESPATQKLDQVTPRNLLIPTPKPQNVQNLLKQATNRNITPGSADSRSTLDAVAVRRYVEQRPPMSTASIGTSIRLPASTYPTRPKFAASDPHCGCPYCGRLIPTKQLQGRQDYWQKHIDADLEPYVCLSEHCTTPFLFFVNMKLWLDHMVTVHSEQWSEIIHMKTWYCDIGHDALIQFNDYKSFLEHFRDPQNHNDQDPPTDTQLDTLSRKKQMTAFREKLVCPLCDSVPDTLRPILPTTGLTEAKAHLYKHIAEHLKTLAFKSLPVLDNTDPETDELSSTKDDNRGRLKAEDSETSVPSGFDQGLRAIHLDFSENATAAAETQVIEEDNYYKISETDELHWLNIGYDEHRRNKDEELSGMPDIVLLHLAEQQRHSATMLDPGLETLADAQNTRSADDYHIGIICTSDMELAVIEAMLDEEYEQEDIAKPYVDKNVYSFGRIQKHNVVIACLPAGADEVSGAARVARDMQRTFGRIHFGLSVGIGSGIPQAEAGPDIRLGDVVVSQPTGLHGGLIQYDSGRSLAGTQLIHQRFLEGPPQALLPALNSLKNKHLRVDSLIPEYLDSMMQKYPKMKKTGYQYPGREIDLLYEANYDHIAETIGCINCDPDHKVIRPDRDSDNPEIHYGTIASINQVIKDPVARDHLREDYGALCVEMEAAGLMTEFPCLVIRGICDYADSHKNDKWRGYAASTAAAYAKELLSYVPIEDILQAEPTGKHVQTSYFEID